MKITRIEASSHRIPIRVPLRDKPILWGAVCVRVETDAGIAGFGLTGHNYRYAVRESINREVAPILVGRDPLPTERHWPASHRRPASSGQSSAATSSRSTGCATSA